MKVSLTSLAASLGSLTSPLSTLSLIVPRSHRLEDYPVVSRAVPSYGVNRRSEDAARVPLSEVKQDPEQQRAGSLRGGALEGGVGVVRGGPAYFTSGANLVGGVGVRLGGIFGREGSRSLRSRRVRGC